MNLNHLNLTVSDVPGTHRFLEKYFGLKGYDGMEPREAVSFMRDDNGLLLALFKGKHGDVAYPSGFHIGFIQQSEDRVNQINQQLQDDGYRVPKPSRLHGSWTFYFTAPGGFMIEVLC